MSFLKKLFGGGKSEQKKEIPGAKTEYKGFLIEATPYVENGQYQNCGVISKKIGDDFKDHRFIRADKYSNVDDAVSMIHVKARQIIDEQGENIFIEN